MSCFIVKWAEIFAFRPAYRDVIENSVEVVLIFIKVLRWVRICFPPPRPNEKTIIDVGEKWPRKLRRSAYFGFVIGL